MFCCDTKCVTHSKIKATSTMKISIPFVTQRGELYHYSRRIPADVLHHYSPAIFHRIALNTGDVVQAKAKAEALTKALEKEHESLRNGAVLAPSVLEKAAKLLAKYGPRGTVAHFNSKEFVGALNLGDFYEETIDAIKDRLYAAKKPEDTRTRDEIFDQSNFGEGTSAVEQQAHQLIRANLGKKDGVIYLSEILPIYLSNHTEGKVKKFSDFAKRHHDYMLKCLGDIPITEMTRSEHGIKFRDYLVEAGFATSTIRRILNGAHAQLNSVALNKELPLLNPFRKLPVVGEGKDAGAIPEFDLGKKQELIKLFKKESKSTARIIRILLNCGARVGEIAQIAVDDVFLDAPIPYVWLRPNSLRDRLKNNTSVRQVVLVGDGLLAMQEAMADHKAFGTKSKAVFPDYAAARGGDSASAACNKRLKTEAENIGWDNPKSYTSKIGRHWWATAARMAGVGRDLRTEVMGHSHGDVHSRYGSTPLALLQETMLKVDQYQGG